MKPIPRGSLAHSQRPWDTLGTLDPMWTILTDGPAKLGNGWDEAELVATVVDDISALIAGLAEHIISHERKNALDFGCGVGRLTQALADYFDNVTGVDIAPSMIARADALNKHCDRCHYVVNAETDLRIFPDSSFDLVYSTLVLQHLGLSGLMRPERVVV